jgi:asparagine synthase (glutamine-hydrolysing)
LSTEALTTTLSEGRPVPVKQILNTTNVICNEQLNHIGAHYGHPYSFPFFDKQVVELGLSTPLSVCFDKGRGRGLIRNGLRTVLPPQIVTRFTKANFVEYGNISARQLYTATHEQFSSAAHPIWGIVDRAVFAKIVTIVFAPKMPVKQKTRYNWLLSRIIYLALWLGSLPK